MTASVTEKQVEQQRSRFKRIVLAMSSMMRNFSMGCRRRMNEVDARKDDHEARKPRSTVDGGAAADSGDVGGDPAESAAPSVSMGQEPLAELVAGESVAIASAS